MIDDPVKMMKGLIWLAPEVNMKTALLNLIDYIFTTGSGDPDEDANIPVEDILNVVMESLVKLHHHVGVDETDDDGIQYGYGTEDTPITEDDVELFKQMLGLIPDATTDKEEEDNDNE